jgi:hypothetical protein
MPPGVIVGNGIDTHLVELLKARIGMGVQGLPFRENPTTLNPLPLKTITSNLHAIDIKLIIKCYFK